MRDGGATLLNIAYNILLSIFCRAAGWLVFASRTLAVAKRAYRDRALKPLAFYDLAAMQQLCVAPPSFRGVDDASAATSTSVIVERVWTAASGTVRVLTAIETTNKCKDNDDDDGALACSDGLLQRARRKKCLLASVKVSATDAVDITDVFNEYVLSFVDPAPSSHRITCLQLICILTIRGILSWKQLACMCLPAIQAVAVVEDTTCVNDTRTGSQHLLSKGAMLIVITSDLEEVEFAPMDAVRL
jgi:hypothetical protein